MTIAQAIVLLLKFANALLQYAQEQKWIKAGEDAEIARTSMAVLQKTETAKQVFAEVAQMTDDQVDAALKKLEP